MIEAIELFFTVVITGMSFSLIVIFAWFVIGMMINFWKIYVRDPKRERNAIRENCKHSSCCYEPDNDLWICNDCGKNFI